MNIGKIMKILSTGEGVGGYEELTKSRFQRLRGDIRYNAVGS